MTRSALVFGDILIVLLTLIAAPMFVWFLRAAFRSGVIETRFGSYDRAERPTAYRLFAIIFGVAAVFCLAAFVFAASDLILGFRTY